MSGSEFPVRFVEYLAIGLRMVLRKQLPCMMACWLSVICGLTATASAQKAQRPNIIVMMSDDMGFSDIQPYGGEIETPTLQRLADNGLRFTQFYNTARCCPTRASLLTGLYPHQAGIGWMMTDRGFDGYRGDLNKNCRTMAEVMKSAGYQTYMSGKWHVTPHVRPGTSQHNWPLQRGFDRFYGTIHGAGSFFDPNSLTRDNQLISPFTDSEYQPETYYYTDAISDHAVRFIDEHDTSKPFFMYVTYTAAHWPMHALPEDIKKYSGKYDQGYAHARAERLKRLHAMGLTDPNWELTEQADDWEQVKHREWELRCMEVYAAMIDRMDQGIGKIVGKLESSQQLDNTLIFFLQDNGGCAEGYGRNMNNITKRADGPTLAPMKASDLQLDMQPKQSRDGFPVLTGPGVLPGPADTYIGYGRGWANVSNTPFREYKHWVHEGGISTPLIAHWPAGIPKKGALDHQPGHLIDIMATCVDVAKAEYPTEVDGHKIKPLEGRSLVPAFRGETIERDAIYWEHEGNRAIRKGKWKLVAKEGKPWELYNMDEDRTETNDLSMDNPDIAKSLAEQWTAYAKRADVLPLGAWRGKPKKTKYNRKQKRFELASKERLDQSGAPYVVGKPFDVVVKIGEWGTDGVLVAHGGSAHGWALWTEKGKLVYGTAVNGKRSRLATTQSLEQAKVVSLSTTGDGNVTISADGKELAQGNIPPITQMPIDGLEVSGDGGGLVGVYPGANTYTGKIESVVIEIGK